MPNTEAEPWVGIWRPHKPKGPIAALYGSPGPKYKLPGLIGHNLHDATKYKAPMFSFGRRFETTRPNTSPGPCYLIPSNQTRKGRDGTPAFSIQSRPKEPKPFPAPGPGHYSPEKADKSLFPCPPAYSMAKRAKAEINCQVPGPASYTLPPILGSKSLVASRAPAYSLSGRHKHGSYFEEYQKTPGPAAYNAVSPCTYRNKPPQYSMTGRNFTPGESRNTKKPGPGAYYTENVTVTKTKAPSFTFGLRHSQYTVPLIDEPEE